MLVRFFSHSRRQLVLFGIAMTFIALRVIFFTGINGSDDVSIAMWSIKILSDGFYVPASHYASRIGLVYPQALVFALFGVGEWQMGVLPMLFSFGGLMLVFLIGKHYGGWTVGLLAMLVLTAFPLDLVFSSQMMPDLPLGTVMGLTFYLLLLAEKKQSRLIALLAGLAWGWAYLIKIEAGFFCCVLLGLLCVRQVSLRTAILCALSVGAVVLTEHLIYFIGSGDLLLRIHLAAFQGGGQVTREYSAEQLWVFPKAWFLTPYYFGTHYYLMFLAIGFLALRRRVDLAPLTIWVIVYLLWLQFGGNPLADTFRVKSHLARYCNMINIPMAVLTASATKEISGLGARLSAYAATLALVVVGIMLMPFNALNAERQIATKKLLDFVKKENLHPLYLDRTSYSIAIIYLYDAANKGWLHQLQKHNSQTMETAILGEEQVSGYLLINRGFVDYQYDRYRVAKVKPEDYRRRFRIYRVVSNPAPKVSYLTVRGLRSLAEFIPIKRFREKAIRTADYLLEGHEAVLLKG